MKPRTRARSLALQVLYEVDIANHLPGDVFKARLEELPLSEDLAEFAALSPRAARVAEMRLFGGMSPEQMATVLGVSRMTADRDWELARAWLAGKMIGEAR